MGGCGAPACEAVSERADRSLDRSQGGGRTRWPHPAGCGSGSSRQAGSVDDLTNAMIRRRQFQSWSVRAPWATFGIFAHRTVGRGSLRRMFHSVVGLENVSARRRHAIRQRSGPNSDLFAREHLFSNRQADLLHRADSSWLGNWTHCCPTKIESGLAHCRFGPDRVDGCDRPNSSQSDIGHRRIRTHQNEFLQSSYFWSVYFPVACYMHS